MMVSKRGGYKRGKSRTANTKKGTASRRADVSKKHSVKARDDERIEREDGKGQGQG